MLESINYWNLQNHAALVKDGNTRARNLHTLSDRFPQLSVDVIIAKQHIIIANCSINCTSF